MIPSTLYFELDFWENWTVPRKNPISEREVQICERLRKARQDTNLSQVAFARLLGIDSSRLASHEHGRVPLRFGLARMVADIADVSLAWLASGAGRPEDRFFVEPKLCEQIDNSDLLSKAYDESLKAFFEPRIREAEAVRSGAVKIGLAKYWGDNPRITVGSDTPYDVWQFAETNLKPLIDSTPPALYADLLSDLWLMVLRFQQRHADAITKFSKSDIPKTFLTDVSTIGNNDAVKAKLPALLKRLNEATLERGAKSALAKFMGVSLPKISQWLSGTHEPGGETTLRLLQWVEQQERSKK